MLLMKKTKRSFAGAMFSKLLGLLFILLISYPLMAQTISGTVQDEQVRVHQPGVGF